MHLALNMVGIDHGIGTSPFFELVHTFYRPSVNTGEEQSSLSLIALSLILLIDGFEVSSDLPTSLFGFAPIAFVDPYRFSCIFDCRLRLRAQCRRRGYRPAFEVELCRYRAEPTAVRKR